MDYRERFAAAVFDAVKANFPTNSDEGKDGIAVLMLMAAASLQGGRGVRTQEYSTELAEAGLQAMEEKLRQLITASN